TGGGGGRVAVYYGDISGFDTANIVAYGGTGRRGRGGAGTVFLKSPAQTYGELIIDNSGISGETPLRSVGSGVITGLTATALTDENADFPVPNSETGALGLIGLELNPNIEQDRTFTIIANTETTITIDASDGDLTEIAQIGDRYVGVYFIDGLTLRGKVSVSTENNIAFAPGGILTVIDSVLEANNILGDDLEIDAVNGTIKLQERPSLDRLSMDNETLMININGPLEVDEITLSNNSSLTFDGLLIANSLTLAEGSSLTHSGATTESISRLELEIETLVIDESSAIDVSG
ncbi:hypothetical protein D1BOALGB6SA_9909, partial [Olavius sp. associated proteobacterium Delta 1]